MSSPHGTPDGVTQLTELMQHGAAEAGPARAPVDPGERRRRRRRGWIAFAIVVALVAAAAGGFVNYALTSALPQPTVTTHEPTVVPAPPAAIALPQDGASALAVTGGEQYFGPDAAALWPAVGGDDARPIASISKLITALVVLDAKPLAASESGPTLTFDKADHALYDKYYVLNATIAAMPTGSTMTQHDALEMMLVISASNYAEAVADWAFGSQPAFVGAAKRWLAANGLAHTKLVEPTGIDPRNTSTPSDMLALAGLAMANPVIAEIVGMPRLDVPGFTGSNTNTLLGVDGIRGLKTGTLEETGANLLYSSSLDVGIDAPLEVTGVVLGGLSRDSIDREVRALLGSISAGFHDVRVGERGDELGTVTTAWGTEARLVLASDATVFTWSDTPIQATMSDITVTTGREGEVVGSVTWTAGDSTDTVDIVLDADLEQPDDWWRYTHVFELGV